ncbi:hypothetical protein HW555_010223 [Spodoptera exigua]|uniref:Uncharacterized protein n=1 Tax=Spodoptera exigua TaxID=7107 RepID=A0A835GBH8_SPOEX|nr:hypothetical protein HW555_010223 [Spodoptera exigua]
MVAILRLRLRRLDYIVAHLSDGCLGWAQCVCVDCATIGCTARARFHAGNSPQVLGNDNLLHDQRSSGSQHWRQSFSTVTA